MKGLLYKDFKSILHSISPAYLMCLIPMIVYIGKNMFLYVIAIIIGLLLGTQVLITISIDERVKLNYYYRVIPLSYYTIAIEKYVFSFLLSLFSAAIVLLITFCYNREFSFLYPFIGAYIVITYDIIMIPSSLYFGTEKGRYILMLFAVLPIFMAKFNDIILKLLSTFSNGLIALVVFLHLIMLLISYAISVKSIRRYIA